MNINNINERVLQFSDYLDDTTGKVQGFATPPINSLKTVNPGRFCTPQVHQYLVNNFVENDYYRFHDIPKERYDNIAIFLLDERMPLEEKRIISSYLDENIKVYIFNEFLKNFVESSNFISKENQGGDLIPFYNPKYNGIPIGHGMDFEILQNILLGKNKIKNEEEFIHLKLFIDSNSYFENEFCPQIVKYYKELFKNEKYSKEFQNYFINRDNAKLNEIINFDKVEHFSNVNQSLKDYIFKSIPQDFDLLEKSIYIYAKLCQILEYDNIYYLNNKSKNHLDEYNISNYDLENNRVVCYTFSYILSDLLRELGVESIKESCLNNHKFNNNHSYIEYLTDDMIIMADSTHKGVEEGDLSKFKFSNELKEIRCSMFDINKQRKFKSARNKVLEYIEYESTQKKDFFPSDEEISKMNDLEKIIVFNNFLISAPFCSVNLLAYAQELKKKLNCNVNIGYFVGDNSEEDIILNVRINPFSLDDSFYRGYAIRYHLDSNTKTILTNNIINESQTDHK